MVLQADPLMKDAHAHLVDYGFKVQLPLDTAQSLEGTSITRSVAPLIPNTVTEVLDSLEEYVRSHPEIEEDPSFWIQGWGWDQNRWKNWDSGFPTAVRAISLHVLKRRT